MFGNHCTPIQYILVKKIRYVYTGRYIQSVRCQDCKFHLLRLRPLLLIWQTLLIEISMQHISHSTRDRWDLPKAVLGENYWKEMTSWEGQAGVWAAECGRTCCVLLDLLEERIYWGCGTKRTRIPDGLWCLSEGFGQKINTDVEVHKNSKYFEHFTQTNLSYHKTDFCVC